MTIANRGGVYQRVALDSRPDVLAKHRELETDPRAIDALDAHLTRERTANNLHDGLRPAAIEQALGETARSVADVFCAIDAAVPAEQQQEDDAIARERAGAQAQGGAAVEALLRKVREESDISRLRALVDDARRMGHDVLEQVTAALTPRLRKDAAREMGIARSMTGPTQLVSGAFALLNELPRLGALDRQSRLDAVRRRADDRKRRILEAAAAVDPALPRLIQIAVLRAAADAQPVGNIVFGRHWQRQRK